MILISNDDGVDSPGIAALFDAVSEVDEAVVVAPDRERSAASHSLTLHRPLRAREIRSGWHAIDGTPTDCVNLGVHGILRERPAMIVSGVNRGPNLGDDVFYSGTVAAAMEGTLLGIPSVAVSLAAHEGGDFAAAASFAAAVVRALAGRPLPPHTLLNVNVPARRPTGRPAWEVTRLGRRRYADAAIERVDPRGRKYFWIGGDELDGLDIPGTDFAAVHAGRISLTPIHLDLTHEPFLAELRGLEVCWP